MCEVWFLFSGATSSTFTLFNVAKGVVLQLQGLWADPEFGLRFIRSFTCPLCVCIGFFLPSLVSFYVPRTYCTCSWTGWISAMCSWFYVLVLVLSPPPTVYYHFLLSECVQLFYVSSWFRINDFLFACLYRIVSVNLCEPVLSCFLWLFPSCVPGFLITKTSKCCTTYSRRFLASKA